jgi:5'-3' exonuclease
MNFILIDTSYLIFYRFFALKRWWELSHAEINLIENDIINPEFCEKFTKTIIESIGNIKKHLKLNKDKCHIISALDCPREQIWRSELYSQYKSNRVNTLKIGDFFKQVYNEDLLIKGGVNHILKYNKLEADDIISIVKNIIRDKYPETNIWIIANDHDYLQLLDDKTHLFNLKYENLKQKKNVFEQPAKNLFYKIVLGDKSDNIKPVFNRCGPTTIEKYYNDPDLFKKELDKSISAQENYKLNNILIDFNNIPSNIKNQFIEKNITYFNTL